MTEVEIRKHNAEVGRGVVKGKIFGIGVADGDAYYEITKVNKKTVRIQWRKDLSDEGTYQDVVLGEGGNATMAIIKPLIDYQDCYEEIVSKGDVSLHCKGGR